MIKGLSRRQLFNAGAGLAAYAALTRLGWAAHHEGDKLPALKDGEQRVFFKAGGEWCFIWTPASFRRDKPAPVILRHSGNNGFVNHETASWFNTPRHIGIANAIMKASGCVIAGSHATGNHWGRASATDAIAALYETLMASGHFDAARVGAIGGGLGGILVWNTALGPLAGKMKSAAMIQGLASIISIVEHGKYKASCLEAHGLPGDMPNDQAIPLITPHDPLPRLRELEKDTPLPVTAIYHGAEDANLLPEGHALPLANALYHAGADVRLEMYPGIGHAVSSMGKFIEDRVAAFFAETLA